MSKFPISVVIYLTDYCYLSCNHCFLSQINNLNKNIIDFDILKKLLKTFKDNNVFMIAFTGGDPMLHPEIFKILKYTSDLGMMPLLGISGVNINNDISKRIYDCGVRCVQIGLNGSNEKTNNLYRGKGNFFKVSKSIDYLQKNNINVNLAFCLDKNNLFDLQNMLNFAKTKKIYKVKIEFWSCINNSKKASLKELNEAEKEGVRKVCDNYMKNERENDWIQYPKSAKQLSKIHSKSLTIMANGDIKTNEVGKILGNIYKNNILDVMEAN